MVSIVESDLSRHLVLAAMLLAILFGYLKGRDVGSASGRSRTWTWVPLIALAVASLGPSAIAIMIYLGYTFGLLQPDPSGYRFSSFIQDLPVEFAVINWPFAVLYVSGRLRADVGSARSAMWCSVVAMFLPNVLLLFLASTMVSNVFDAGQGIGIIESVVIFPVIAMIWPDPSPGILAVGVGILSALTSPIPVLGLIGWLVGHVLGGTATHPTRKSTLRP